jgi:hypothetical protein
MSTVFTGKNKMADDILYTIDLDPIGGSPIIVTLGNAIVSMIPRYNYTASVWTLDILDTSDNVLAAGLMLVPNIDILTPYQQLKRELGSIYVTERYVGDHKNPDLLGTNVKLLWYAPGADIIFTGWGE